MGTNHLQIDSTDEPDAEHSFDEDARPSESVIHAVAAATGRDPLEMQPLQETIDTDALNKVLESRPDDVDEPPPRVSFQFEGCTVRVDGNGHVAVTTPGTDK